MQIVATIGCRFAALCAALLWIVAACGAVLAENRPPAPGCMPDTHYTHQVRAVRSWSALDIVPLDEPGPSAAVAQVELDRIGGSGALIEIDVGDIRKQLVDEIRRDVRMTLLNARIPWSRPPSTRNGAVEVQIREAGDVDRASRALASWFAAPGERDADRLVDMSNVGDRVLRLAPIEAVVAERLRAAEESALLKLQRRAQGLGIATANVKPDGVGRIRVLLPGIADPHRLVDILDDPSRVDLRLVDTSMNPCDALKTRPPRDSEVLYRDGDKTPYLVHKQVLAFNDDLTDVTIGLDRATGEPIVAFRIDAMAAGRFEQAIREHVGQPLAIVVDQKIVAVPLVVESLERSVRISGGFTVEAAKELALFLRSGLFFKLNIVESQVIAPKAAK